MEHSEINLYIALMMDVKHRIKFIKQIFEGETDTGTIETNVEFCGLQLRKILELISLSSLVMNKEEFEKQNIKYQKFWNSKRILHDIETINPDFYPKPMAMDQSRTVSPHAVLSDLQNPFLNKEMFVNVYDKLGKLMHNDNPFGEKTDYKYYKDNLLVWVNLVVQLLNLHLIRLLNGDGFYLVYLYNQEDELVHARHYPTPSVPEK